MMGWKVKQESLEGEGRHVYRILSNWKTEKDAHVQN
jgi:hypothetical protein